MSHVQTLLLLLILCISYEASGQLALMFNVAIQDKYVNRACDSWDEWPSSKCIWINGRQGSHWSRPYLHQLSDTCKDTEFYKMINKTFGGVLNSAFEYFRLINYEKLPCGYCSFKARCGRDCKKRFYEVQERTCPDITQGHACRTTPEYFGSIIPESCDLWPNELVDFSGLNPTLQAEAKKLKMFNCLPGFDDRLGKQTCFCCCAPNKVNIETKMCEQPSNRGRGQGRGNE